MFKNSKILIVEGRFYEDISDELFKGAVDILDEAKVKYERIGVPGAFEIPQVILHSIHTTKQDTSKIDYAGFIALGCVIRGETSHYEYVCKESSRGLMDIVLQHRVALGYGILTVENYEQAWERASTRKKNKGGDVAKACLRMMEVKKYFQSQTL